MNRREILNTYKYFIENTVQPDVYMVATLKQSAGTYAAGYRTFRKGDQDLYEAASRQFRKRVSIAVYGATNVSRYSHLIPMAVTLEGGENGALFHLNILTKTPHFMSFEKFRLILLSEWRRSDWAMRGVYVKERTGNCVGYSLKEGYERILIP